MSESFEIHKFGGSCLRDARDLDRIADVLRHSPNQTVVVVSALWGTTDRLMRAAKEPRYAARLTKDLASQHLRFTPNLVDSPLFDVFQRVLDGIEDALEVLATEEKNDIAYNQLLASGERLSALVVAFSLQERGLDAHPVGSEDIGLCLNGTITATTVDLEKSARLLDRTALYGTPVVTGWFGQGRDGNIALLGRGGSDHTASAIGSLLDAERIVLWKDVLGIYPVNPRWGIECTPITYLGYAEAMEFARLDAPIIHPATVEPVYFSGIPIEIRHLYSYEQTELKTVIGPDIQEISVIKGVACIPKVACINVKTMYIHDSANALNEVLTEFRDEGLRICCFESTQHSMRFILPQHEVNKAVQCLKARFTEVSHTYAAAMVSLIGTNVEVIPSEIIESFEWSDTSFAKSTNAIHLLTQRTDTSRMLEELVQILNVANNI